MCTIYYNCAIYVVFYDPNIFWTHAHCTVLNHISHISEEVNAENLACVCRVLCFVLPSCFVLISCVLIHVYRVTRLPAMPPVIMLGINAIVKIFVL